MHGTGLGVAPCVFSFDNNSTHAISPRSNASVRYSVIAGILYLVIVAVVALIAGHKSAQVATIDSNPQNDHNNSKQPNNGKIRFGSNASTSLTGVGADDSTCDTAIMVASRREATFGFMKSDGLSHLGAAPRDRVTASHQVAPAFGAMGGTPARLSWAFKSARTGVLAASLARVS